MKNAGEFATARLPEEPTEIAPDGSAARVLLGMAGGTLAHFELHCGRASRAVKHRTVDEIWFVQSGRGELWRKQDARQAVVALEPGVCVTLPCGTHFQFRASDRESLTFIAVTMPPWPGDQEVELVGDGPWLPSTDVSRNK